MFSHHSESTLKTFGLFQTHYPPMRRALTQRLRLATTRQQAAAWELAEVAAE